jgi:pimeloyl-ACP methyl ester carboxylesterase
MDDTSSPAPAVFILVHGGFSGGFCWVRVADRLRGAGHRVFTPTLTGLSDRAHLMTGDVNLSTHVADIVGLMESENLHDVVLCGHSYGGMVITGVAEQMASRLHALVYLDAVIPAPGTCLWDYLTEEQHRLFESQTEGFGVKPVYPGPMVVNPADADWLAPQRSPHPRASFHERLPETTHRDTVPVNVHVRATLYESAMMDDCHERARKLGWTCFSLPFAHDLMLDAPDDVCDILVAAALQVTDS